MRTIKLLSVLALVTLMTSGCSPSDPNAPKPTPKIIATVEVDGCEVKYIDNPQYPNFYIARCGNTVTNTWQRRSGKTTITEASINVNSEEELRRRLAEVEARNKALKKLSDEDKKLLGVQ